MLASHESYLRHFRGVSKFVKTVGWSDYNWTAMNCGCLPRSACVATCAMATPIEGSHDKTLTLLWARSVNYSYEPSPLPRVSGAAVTVQSDAAVQHGGCVPPGGYARPQLPLFNESAIAWYNTSSGERMEGVTTPPNVAPFANRAMCQQSCVQPPQSCPQLALPDFTTDIVAVVVGKVTGELDHSATRLKHDELVSEAPQRPVLQLKVGERQLMIDRKQ